MRTFLTAEWRHLLMLNYAIDPAVLRPHVPAGTELDAWNGTNYVSVVGFLFLQTRVLGIPVPSHRNFEEVNLRFYVRRRGPEGWRRGVVFIKEIVPRRAIAAIARVCYDEPYVALPMRHRIESTAGAPAAGAWVEYAWRFHGRWNSMRAKIFGQPEDIAPGSEVEFITEHYWGYTKRRDGRCSEYQVEHPRWSAWPARDETLDCDVAALYGEEFCEALHQPCRSTFVADGSPVSVHTGVRLRLSDGRE